MMIDIWLDSEREFGIKTNEHDVPFNELMDTAPQKRWRVEQYWTLPCTEPNMKFLAGQVVARYGKAVEISQEARFFLGAELMRAKALDIKAKRRAEYVFSETAPTITDYKFCERYPPKKHQLVGFDACRNQRSFALFMEMGTGKTKVSIDRLCYELIRRCGMGNAGFLKACSLLPEPEDLSPEAADDRKNGVYRVLVIAPKSVVMNWGKQLALHATVPYTFQAMLGDASDRLHAIGECLKSKTRLKIIGVNYDALSKYSVILKMCRFHLIIADESTRIKTPSAKRTKQAIELAETAENRMVLSGQPITKNVLDLYSQCEFLAPGEALLGYDTFAAFAKRYSEKDKHSGKFIPRNVEELKERIARFAFIVKKKECLDLPDKIYEPEIVEMVGEQLTQYRNMRDELIAQLTDDTLIGGKGVVSVKHVIVRMLRLAQITSGFLPVPMQAKFEGDANDFDALLEFQMEEADRKERGEKPEYQIVEFTPNPKLERCVEIVDETVDLNDAGQKIIIWARFKHDIKAIAREITKLDIPCVTLFGSTKHWEREAAIDAFNTNDGVRVFIGQPQSGGIGIDLLGSERCPTGLEIFYSNDFNLESRGQAEDRAHRMGMHRPVTIVDLLCKGSIDEIMLDRLMEKREFSEGFTDAKAMAMALLAGTGT